MGLKELISLMSNLSMRDSSTSIKSLMQVKGMNNTIIHILQKGMRQTKKIKGQLRTSGDIKIGLSLERNRRMLL